MQNGQTAPEPVAIDTITAVAPAVIEPSKMILNVSPDKLAATIHFTGFDAIVAGELGDTPINSAILEVSLSKPDGDGHRELIGYTVDIKGNFDLESMARGSVTLIFDSQAETLEFPYPPAAPIDLCDADDTDVVDGHRSGDFNKRFFFLSHRAGDKIPVTSPVRMQIIVQVTGSSDDRATLIVDSIDVEARTAAG